MTDEQDWYVQHRYYCPLSSCWWTCADNEAVRSAAPPGARDYSASAAVLGHYERIETMVRTHLETHALLEWVTEINRMTGLMGLVALELGDGGRIGQLTALVAAPGSPAAEGRTECLEWLRQGIGSKTHPDLASFITGLEAGRD